MKILNLLVALVAVGVFSLSGLAAGDQAAEATVVKVNGAPTVVLPGSSTAVALTVGMKLPPGSVINTGAGAEVHVQPFVGAVTTIQGNSSVAIEELSVTRSGNTVKKQNVLLNVRSGNVVSTLDPEKKAVNSYSVRTPKGVAAARGTAYAVNVTAAGVTIVAAADTVSFTSSDGTSYSIQAGTVVMTPAGGEPQPPVPLGSAAAGGSDLAAIINSAVQALAEVVQNNLGGISSESTINLAAQIAAVAATALPDQATAITSQIVTALASNGAVTGNSSNTGVAVAAVTAAVARVAPTQAAQVAAAAASAAPQQAGAAAAAAAQAVPGSGAAVNQAVAQSTGQSVAAVQQAATQASAQAASGVAAANAALNNVVLPPNSAPEPIPTQPEGQDTTTEPEPLDPSTVSNAT